MRKIVLIFTTAFLSLGLGSANAQVHPRLLGDKDVFKMEDEATQKWKTALPRLMKDFSDYNEAWRRLKLRADVLGQKWVVFSNGKTDAEVKQEEMYRWCGLYFFHDTPPNKYGKDAVNEAAEKFGRLETRVKLCEETPLPQKNEQAKK